MAKKKVEQAEVRGDLASMTPRFATVVRSQMSEDHFTLDFAYATGEEVHIHLGRFIITPEHAERLRDLITRQLRVRDDKINARKKKAAPKRKTVRKVARKKSTRKVGYKAVRRTKKRAVRR